MSRRLRLALHRRRHRERYALLEQLLRNQRLSRAQLMDKQRRDFAAIVRHAFDTTPFYREKYAGVLGGGAGVEASALPILSKDEVIRHRDRMVADDVDASKLKIGHTGGSTGKPVSFYYDAYKGELMRAGMCRSYMWSGWMPGEKILNFWGARQDIKGGTRIRKLMKEFAAAEKTIAAYEFSEEQLHRWAEQVKSYRPVLLQGYASILAELAGFVVANKIRMPDTIVGVFSTAEVLYGWQRGLMEQAFGCKVFNQYGSREIPNIACECRHGNQHVFTDMVYLESLGAGDEDRLAVTSLTNRVMPFIRYEIGDSGRLKEGECACGSPFPMLEMGVCRSNDMVRTRSGKRIYPAYFVHLLDGIGGVRQYQFVQVDVDTIMLYLAAESELAPDTLHGLRARIRAEVDETMALEVRYVDEIGRSVSGKHRFVISNC